MDKIETYDRYGVEENYLNSSTEVEIVYVKFNDHQTFVKEAMQQAFKDGVQHGYGKNMYVKD
jgi:hypothetical protein